jgi:hypothetical protein
MFISKAEKNLIFHRLASLDLTTQNLFQTLNALQDFKSMSSQTKQVDPVKESEPNSFDLLESIFPQRTRSKAITPYGSLCAYTYPYINDIKVGQTVKIPAMGEFTLKRIQRSITAHLQKKFGKKSYQTRISYLTGNVEIVRIK